jgi:hypothetical protein
VDGIGTVLSMKLMDVEYLPGCDSSGCVSKESERWTEIQSLTDLSGIRTRCVFECNWMAGESSDDDLKFTSYGTLDGQR